MFFWEFRSVNTKLNEIEHVRFGDRQSIAINLLVTSALDHCCIVNVSDPIYLHFERVLLLRQPIFDVET